MTATAPQTSSVVLARTGRHSYAALIVLFLVLGILAYSILQSLVTPALPLLANEMGVTTADTSWIFTSYLIAASVMTPIVGRLGDMRGKRRILLWALLALAVGTLVCAIAPNLPVLIAGRLIQGGAGAVLPLSIGIVRDELARERVGVVVGVLSSVFGIGAAVGLVLAGPIVENLGWRWLFWLPLALTVIAIIGVVFGVPETRVRAPGRLDVLGAGILMVTLTCLLLVITKSPEWGWTSTRSLSLLAVGIVGLVSFLLVERRVPEPLVNLRLLVLRGVWTTNLVTLAFGFLMFGAFLLLPFLLELSSSTGYGFGKSVSQAGLFLLPMTGVILIFGPLSGMLDRRYGPRVPLIAGTLSLVISFLIPAVSHDHAVQLLLSGVFCGAGFGLAFAAIANAIIESVPATHTGEATSINSIIRTIGGAVGTVVIAVVLTANTTADGTPTNDAFSIGFYISAGVAMVALIAAFAVPSRKRARELAAAAGVTDLPPEVHPRH